MLFIETPLFTKRVKELLDDESYRLLQLALAISPTDGDLIEGTGGLRKIRVAAKGHGKRSGARVIYYHFVSASQIAMLYVYPKNVQVDLCAEQRKALMKLIKHWSPV
ncbi:type II toxin-antitoxin system RelE/ParE family toxin [Pseudomonas putida]|uniref:type II toxin-antitoxin system RelE/ParE family toxin n=1 Tax=Pseudomonas putida TaxID=303 RepID=UPI000818F7C9|nr:type II toxin-antitoxin system RelE/ParE family toxin [Pseudomonas putida]OCT38560.1 toxin HigB-2 [Pseudomonas putida]